MESLEASLAVSEESFEELLTGVAASLRELLRPMMGIISGMLAVEGEAGDLGAASLAKLANNMMGKVVLNLVNINLNPRPTSSDKFLLFGQQAELANSLARSFHPPGPAKPFSLAEFWRIQLDSLSREQTESGKKREDAEVELITSIAVKYM